MAAGLALAAAPTPPAPPRPRVVAYVPNWIDVAAFAKTIDYSKVTHLNVAFANPVNDLGVLSVSTQDDALLAAAHRHGVKVLISIGGGAAAENKVLKPRYFLLQGQEHRVEFVARAAAYVIAHGYDGLDVDLEGPSIGPDYGRFVTDLAAVLHPKGKLLTAAVSQGYGGSKIPNEALAVFDFINVMAYDATGTWAPNKPGQHASFEFARDNLNFWLKRGVPRNRVVLGVPFYGYGFGKAFRKRDYPYKDILASFPGAEQRDQTGDTIWYNGIPTIRAKARLVREQGLGGVMIWSLDYDVPGPRSLLAAIHAELQTPVKTANAVATRRGNDE